MQKTGQDERRGGRCQVKSRVFRRLEYMIMHGERQVPTEAKVSSHITPDPLDLLQCSSVILLFYTTTTTTITNTNPFTITTPYTYSSNITTTAAITSLMPLPSIQLLLLLAPPPPILRPLPLLLPPQLLLSLISFPSQYYLLTFSTFLTPGVT